ncbi:MAG: bifunctional riboflavin kinase/FAD synthetase [Bdellovibrionota bacterium]
MDFKIIQNTMPIPSTCSRQSAVTIGNFDGCHLGHQTLINRIIEEADSSPMQRIAISFTPHPEMYFHPNKSQKLQNLFMSEQKSRAFSELGIDIHIEQEFNDDFSHLSREAFLENYLLASLQTKVIVVGENFLFGYQRKGSANWLKSQAQSKNLKVEVLPPSLFEDKPISSTRIRRALAEQGDVEAAFKMLGRPYLIDGIIVKGKQLGRSIGIPTINLSETRQLTPKNGVYVGRVFLNKDLQTKASVMSLPNNSIPAVFNVGLRPTINNNEQQIKIEAHLLYGSWELDQLYGYSAGFYFQKRLRDEKKFANLEELKIQINKDIHSAKMLF